MNILTERPKAMLYEQVARIARATASPARLELLELLGQGEKRVDALAAAAGMDFKNTSAQLRALRAARLVDTRKEGVSVYYRLASDQVASLVIALRQLAEERLAELRELIGRYLAEPATLTPLDGPGLLRKARRGEVTVIDVRPADEYLAGHLPGARSVPLTELTARIGHLPRRRAIVAYCRGPYCFLSVEAVALLRRRGFRATRLNQGVREWQAAGLPVKVGA